MPIEKNVQPVAQPYRKVPIPLVGKGGKDLQDLLDTDVIKQVNQPSK